MWFSKPLLACFQTQQPRHVSLTLGSGAELSTRSVFGIESRVSSPAVFFQVQLMRLTINLLMIRSYNVEFYLYSASSSLVRDTNTEYIYSMNNFPSYETASASREQIWLQLVIESKILKLFYWLLFDIIFSPADRDRKKLYPSRLIGLDQRSRLDKCGSCGALFRLTAGTCAHAFPLPDVTRNTAS